MEQFEISLVSETFNNANNYLIEYTEKKNNICAIYFSSNGIYFPNQEEIFRKEIINKNKFEWYKTRVISAKKQIFLRDIYKQWYINGVNKKLNNIEDLYEFLKTETEGYEVITIGSSAGGYAAALFGSLLKASRVYSFASQFGLYHILNNNDNREKNPMIVNYFESTDSEKYLNITEIIKTSNVPVFYFLPFFSAEDLEQFELLSFLKNIYCFKIDCDFHGMPISHYSLGKTINFEKKKLMKIHERINGKIISPVKYESYCIGFFPSLFIAVGMKIKSMIRSFLKFKMSSIHIIS